jgi:beta-phosphoglucomutase-like phosphatase (HAD superfamily)
MEVLMKNFSAVIFDMDGTIVQTENIWKAASASLLAKSSLDITPEQYQELYDRSHGLAMKETCMLIKEYGQLTDSVEELMIEKKIIARALYAQGISFVSGFPEFHKKIADFNLKTGVATNADEYTLDVTNKVMNLSQFFGEHMYSIASVDNRCKPSPDIYLYVADKLKVAPHNCMAVEDSAHGIAAAKAAGMWCIGINTSGDLNQLREADLIISSYHDIDLTALGKK